MECPLVGLVGTGWVGGIVGGLVGWMAGQKGSAGGIALAELVVGR